MNPDNKPIDMPDTFEEAERFQRLFVKPMVDAVCQKMESHLEPLVAAQKATSDKLTQHDTAIAELKGRQTKALLGWGVYASGAAIVIGLAFDWLKKKIGWN